MMTKIERTIVRWLTAVFYGISLFLLVGIAFWFYPRTVVKSATLMQTDKLSYKLGERVIVSGETHLNANTQADFDVRLICNNVKYYYTTINDLNLSKQTESVKYRFPYPSIPEYLPKGECRIETTAHYPISVLPLLTRDYFYTFISNTFEIKE